MMKRILATASLVLVAALASAQEKEAGWKTIFDGTSLDGWKSNDEVPGCFTIEDGALKVEGGRAHLFYVGKDGKASFRNFEVRLKVKTTSGSNSGVYVATQFQEKGWPEKGYECQVNSTHKDRKKTGGLYAIVDVLDDAPSTDGEWFVYDIKVDGQKITVKVDGKVTAEYEEPADAAAQRPDNMKGRLLAPGTIGIQAHDPKSVTYYEKIELKILD